MAELGSTTSGLTRMRQLLQGMAASLKTPAYRLVSGLSLVLVLCTILYLLAGFSAALDAISFQERVQQIIGRDDRILARSVLNKLDEIHRNDPAERPLDVNELPIETLALQLDRVKAVTAQLAVFENAIVLPENTVDRAASSEDYQDIISQWINDNQPAFTVTTEEDKQEVIDQLLRGLALTDEDSTPSLSLGALQRELGNDLAEEVTRLGVEIDNNVPGLRMVRSLERIQGLLENIDHNAVLSAAINDSESASAPDPLGSFKAADELQEKTKQLNEQFLQLRNSIPLNEAAQQQASVAIDQVLADLELLGTLLQGSLKRIQDNAVTIQETIATINQRTKTIADLVLEPKPLVLNEIVKNLPTREDIIESLQTASTDRPRAPAPIDDTASTPDESTDPLKLLGRQTDELFKLIGTTLPELETIRMITPSLTAMEVASNALTTLEIDSERIRSTVDGQVVTGFEAANLYKQQVSTLAAAITAMTESLQKLSDEGLLAQLLTDDPQAMSKAGMLLREHRKISRAEFPLTIKGWNLIDPAVLAVASREKLDIMLVLIVGAIGSMIYMTQRMLKLIMHAEPNDTAQRMPLLWYIARPVFGAVVAFAVYLIYQTGQIAFGTGGLTEALQNGINIPILTTIGLFAGLLSWQALDTIQSKGEVWLKSERREPRWATGLARVLAAREKTDERCAQHLGVSIGQIDRWIRYQDKVTPEMQDRLTSWLGVGAEELFSTTVLAKTQNQKPLYAIGLKPYLQRIDAHYSITSIALALGVEDELVERWRDQKQPVPSEYHWQLLELVKERFAYFYAPVGETDRNWSVLLRQCMAKSDYASATSLASKLNVNEDWIRKWRDLYEPVPAPTARRIAEAMQVDFHTLFDAHYDRIQDQSYANKRAMTDAIVQKFGTHAAANDPNSMRTAKTAFAQAMDVDREWADDWLEGRKELFKPTREAIVQLLNQDPSTLFSFPSRHGSTKKQTDQTESSPV